jgi:hypothetical protein
MRCKFPHLDGNKYVVRSQGLYVFAVVDIKLVTLVLIHIAGKINGVLIKNKERCSRIIWEDFLKVLSQSLFHKN